MKRALVAGLTLSLLLAGACGGDDDDAGAAEPKEVSSGSTTETISVVANFYPVYEAVKEIGGDRVEARNLTPPGTEPHDLELSPKEVDALLDADLVVYLGKGFQPAVQKVVKQRDGASVDLLEGLELRRLEAEEGPGKADEAAEAGDGGDEEADGLEGGLDPHVWLDPALMVQVVDELKTALAKAEPQFEEDFARNARVYRDKIQGLDAQYAFGLKDCERRVLVTSHAAFGYLTRRYRLEQHGISGLSPEAEPDPARLAELTDEVKKTGTTTVFAETLASPRVAETLAKEAGVKTDVLNPVEGLSEKEIKAGETYVTVMQHNLEALKKALGCAN